MGCWSQTRRVLGLSLAALLLSCSPEPEPLAVVEDPSAEIDADGAHRASDATARRNAQTGTWLAAQPATDLELARRGLIAREDRLDIRTADGQQKDPPTALPTTSVGTGPAVAGGPAPSATGPDSFDDMTLLAVRGVSSLRDLTALRQALSQAPGVASVEVRSLDGDQVLIQLSPAGLAPARDVAGLSECGESQGRALYCWQP